MKMTDSNDMSRCGKSFGWLDVALSYNRMVLDSAEVVLRRSVDMASGRMSAEEAQRMVWEKPLAFADAAHRSAATAMFGGSPSWVAETAVTTIGDTAAGNAMRLRRTD